MLQSIARDLLNRGSNNIEYVIKEIKRELKNAMKDMVSSFD